MKGEVCYESCVQKVSKCSVYDAWGNCTVLTNLGGIADVNPFRYRGYYYDNETSLFSVGPRYYDPEIGRWINPDDISVAVSLGATTINGLNLYAYCFNDPINYVDYGGYWPQRIGDWNVIDKSLRFRLNDKDHIHVEYNGKEYSWYRNGHKTRHSGNYGLKDLSKTAQKALQKAGVPSDYFSKMTYVQLPRWQEGFSIVTMPRWQEGFSILNLPPYQEGFSIVNMPPYQEGFSIVEMPRWQEGFSLPQIDRNTVTTIIVVAAVALVAVCVVGAFFTGGQSLWGLLALA